VPFKGEVLLRSSIVGLEFLGAPNLIFVVPIYLLQRARALEANAPQAVRDRSTGARANPRSTGALPLGRASPTSCCCC
jgi:hypothetical protein